MILANITSYIGRDSMAEHYYCSYHISDNNKPNIHNSGSSFDAIDLEREIVDEEEAKYLNRKNHYTAKYFVGRTINNFGSINQIHLRLQEEFPNDNIITYENDRIFKEMLCIIDGVNLGVKYFGEVFIDVPTSCYKDLLPDLNTIKIKCDDCGHEYTLDEVTSERKWGDRILIQFLSKWNVDDRCCKYLQLVWNVVL